MNEHKDKQDDADGAAARETSLPFDIHRVGVRVPPFYPEKPALWFAQLEGQFALANITADSTRFHYAMGQLDPIYASEVEDIITAPPANDKYERLKTELIKRLSASREKKVKQLLTHEELGDRKPSQFLRHLRHLAGPGVPEEFLKTIWTSRLPSSTQTIVASQSRATLEEIADLADRLQDIVPASPQVAATSSADTSMANQIAELTRQVHTLTTQLDRMSRPRNKFNSNRGNSHDRNRSRGHSQSSISQSNYRKFPVCWYHSKYGNEATRCSKPCDYAGKA